MQRDIIAQESTVLGLLRLMADTNFNVVRSNGLSALLALVEHAPEVSHTILCCDMFSYNQPVGSDVLALYYCI